MLLLAPVAPALASQVLRISAIPDQNPERLNRLYGLLAKELSDQLGVPVKYKPAVDYGAAVTGFRRGIWIWSFGGLTGAGPLADPWLRHAADVDAKFRSVFIANQAAGLKPFSAQKDLQQLKGKRFAFGSESSTSGRLMPQYFLARRG